MAEFDTMKAMLRDIDAATNASAARLATVGSQINVQNDRLAALIATLLASSGMTEEQKAELAADAASITANLTNVSSSLDDEVARLTATGVTVTDPTPTTEVNTVNQAGADNGIGAVGDIIANDNPNLATYKSNGWVDTAIA